MLTRDLNDQDMEIILDNIGNLTMLEADPGFRLYSESLKDVLYNHIEALKKEHDPTTVFRFQGVISGVELALGLIKKMKDEMKQRVADLKEEAEQPPAVPALGDDGL